MKVSTIVLSVSGGLGLLGGVGTLTNHFLNTSKVSDILTKKGHTLLSFEDDKDLPNWKIIAKSYSNSQKNKLKDLTIEPILNTNIATDQNAKNLRKVCKDIINLSKYTNENLLSAEQWCVKPITIKDLVSQHRKVLDFDQSTDNEQNKWEEKVTSYLDAKEKPKIAGVTITTRATDKATDRKTLKNGCKGLADKVTHDTDFHGKYEQFEKWCTIPK